MKIIEDVTDTYYDMLNSFRADNFLKVQEVKENNIAFRESFFDIEKRLIKNDDSILMKNIELLEDLEFNLRHEFIKIVKVKLDGVDKE